MKEKAIEKIKAEMEAGKTNGNIAAAGEMLIQYLGQHPQAAAAVMVENATLTKACQAMHDEARRRAGGKGSFWMSDAEGFTLILEYFGLTANAASAAAPNFDVDLDALLGL